MLGGGQGGGGGGAGVFTCLCLEATAAQLQPNLTWHGYQDKKRGEMRLLYGASGMRSYSQSGGVNSSVRG